MKKCRRRSCSTMSASLVRIDRFWLLLTLLFWNAVLACCFVPPPNEATSCYFQRQSQSMHPSASLLLARPKRSAVSTRTVRNSNSTVIRSENNINRRDQSSASKKKKRNKKSTPPQKRTQPSDPNTTEESSSDKVTSRLQELHERAENKQDVTQAYCDSVLALCVACDEWDSVLDVLTIMKQYNLTQQRSTYRACLQTCFELSNGASAHEILTAMEQAQQTPDPTDVSLAVAAMCRSTRHDWKRAMNFLMDYAKREIGVVPVEAYDAVLTYVPPKAWKESARLLHTMERDKLHPMPILSSYRTVIETCVAAQQAEQAFQILTSMPKKGLTPTVFSFEVVMSALAKQRAWRRALQLLDVMDDLQVPKTVVTYNTVISACARSAEIGTAKNLLAKMKKQGVRPNVISFNSLMTACVSTSRWKDALSLLDQCHREPGCTPDIITYTNAMRACAKGRQTKRALTLLQVVKDMKLPIDNYCYTAVIDACAKGKMWRKALELLDEMEQNGIMPNEITYSVAINACGNGGQWERALALLDQMKEKSMCVNLITYNSAITALSKASKMNAKFHPRTNNPTQLTSSKSEAVSIDGDQLWIKAFELIDQIKADGMEPDGFSYSAAISCCGAGGRWKEALDLIKIMQQGGPKTRPNKIAYTAAISACGRSGEYKEALKLFSDMKNSGLQPDRVAYNAVFTALRIANMPDEAYELWSEMCGKKQAKSTALATAKASSSVSPDIITLTDVIGTLSRAETVDKKKIDKVFHDAVERGIVLSKNSLDSDYEVDLTGMTLPVARAACRYIFQRILAGVRKGQEPEEVSLLTGVGRFQQMGNSDDGSTTTLREYILLDLEEDFEPQMHGVIPERAQGTVVIDKGQVENWIAGQ